MRINNYQRDDITRVDTARDLIGRVLYVCGQLQVILDSKFILHVKGGRLHKIQKARPLTPTEWDNLQAYSEEIQNVQ